MNIAHAGSGPVPAARVPAQEAESRMNNAARPLGIWPLVNATPVSLRAAGQGRAASTRLASTRLASTRLASTRLASAPPVSPQDLARLVHAIVADPGHWAASVRFGPRERWYQRLALTGHLEVWLLSWLPGQSTGFHDHGAAVGAFTVAQGELTERTVPAGQATAVGRACVPGRARPFGPEFVHDVVNASAAPAVSVHAYSPPLSAMRRFELTTGGLVHTGTETAEEGW
jgi:predicted metal-dependent enzyme (double-stranded beta helix superfamily)